MEIRVHDVMQSVAVLVFFVIRCCAVCGELWRFIEGYQYCTRYYVDFTRNRNASRFALSSYGAYVTYNIPIGGERG